MGQLPFTLTYRLGKANKRGECLVYLRYYSKQLDCLIPSSVRVLKSQFDIASIKKPINSHPNKDALNTVLNNLRIEIESRIAKANVEITTEFLKGKGEIVSGADLLTDYIEEFIRLHTGKLSQGRIEHYEGMLGEIHAFDQKVKLSGISSHWLLKLENHFRNKKKTLKSDETVGENTVVKKMKVIKAVLNYAIKNGDLEIKSIQAYKMPAFTPGLPEYLTESEIEAFKKVVEATSDKNIKSSGYYFLLSCYAGYRLADLMSFRYEKRVRDGIIVLRAGKNGKIVSIPVYPRLAEILEYCKDRGVSVIEQEFRKQVKQIAELAGIKNRNIKIHSGRHTFAMLMLSRGLTVDEVAELLGDSKDVAKIYARIINSQLHKRVMQVMG